MFITHVGVKSCASVNKRWFQAQNWILQTLISTATLKPYTKLWMDVACVLAAVMHAGEKENAKI